MERDRHQDVFKDLIAEGISTSVFAARHCHDACVALLTMRAGATIGYRPGGALTADDIAERCSGFALAIVERP